MLYYKYSNEVLLMYGISSELASQIINKNTVWECLLTLGKVSGELTPDIAKRMIVEGWAVGVRVVIQRGYQGIKILKGLSTIISADKIITQFMQKILSKSVNLNVIHKSERLFLVDSFQDQRTKHVVNAQPDGLTCSCMLFKCLNKRMGQEAPQLIKALGQVISEDGSKICVTEVYDHATRTIEEKIHLQCHHIQAVMKQMFNASTSLDYVLNWKQVINNYKFQQAAKNQDNLDSFSRYRGISQRRTD